MNENWEFADERKRVITPELKALIAEARSRFLRERYPNLKDDQDREIADSEARWQAILRQAGR
jgi:hypothetical protein